MQNSGQVVNVDLLVTIIGEQAVENRVLRGQLAQANAALEAIKKINDSKGNAEEEAA